MLDYRIETFLTLCETCSYTKTAQRLHLTQPSVTQHIKALEQFYQCQLFRYEGRRVTLTEAGLYLQAKMQMMRAQETGIQKRICGIRQVTPMMIGITPSIVYSHLMETLCGQMKADAACFLHLQLGNSQTLLRLLREGSLDAAILEGEVSDAQMDQTILCQERLLAVANTTRAEMLYGCSWQKLFQQTLLLPEAGSGLRTILQNQLRSRGITFHDFIAVCEVNSLEILKQLLYQDVGVAFLFSSTIQRDLEENRLKRVYMDTSAAFGNLSFVVMRNRLEQEKLCELKEMLETICTEA